MWHSYVTFIRKITNSVVYIKYFVIFHAIFFLVVIV